MKPLSRSLCSSRSISPRILPEQPFGVSSTRYGKSLAPPTGKRPFQPLGMERPGRRTSYRVWCETGSRAAGSTGFTTRSAGPAPQPARYALSVSSVLSPVLSARLVSRIALYLPPCFPWPVVSGVTRPKLRNEPTWRVPIHIECWSSDAADPATSEYVLTFGGPPDGVGTVLLSNRKGLLAVRQFLESAGVLPSDVETVC